MAETSSVVRDGKGNRNSHSPTFLFSVWGHSRILRVSKIKLWTPHVGEKATTVRESGNEHNRFAVSEYRCSRTKRCAQLAVNRSFFLVIQDHSLFTSLVVQRYRFPQYQKRSILWELEVVCNTHFRLSSLSFLNLALLLDRRFLIMRHISNVVS